MYISQSHKNIKQHKFFNINNNKEWLWFLKDHVALKAVVMMLEIQLCISTINYILTYIKVENTYYKLQ